MIRVVLADDAIRVRSALRLLLEQLWGYQIVGEADCIAELFALTEDQRPDLVLLDWELPKRPAVSGANGASARVNSSGRLILQQLKHCWPALKVIVMSGRLEARQAALLAGADSFVSKSDSPSQLLMAIRQNSGHRQACGVTVTEV